MASSSMAAVMASLVASASPGDFGPKTIALNTGAEMPFVNLGGYILGTGDHFSNYTEYLRQGGRGLDTALTYSDTVNLEISAAVKEHPEIDRGDIFLTTKVPCCPSSEQWCDVGEYNGTIAQDIARNNELLQSNYTDLTLLHWPCNTFEQTIQRYVQLQDAQEAGHTKAIGVSNFGVDLLKAMAADDRVKVVPAVNQCNHAIGNHNESHAPKLGGDDLTVQYCQEHGIVYEAYSPLEGLPGKDVFKLPGVMKVAAAHNVSGAQVALRWLVQQNITIVTAVRRVFLHLFVVVVVSEWCCWCWCCCCCCCSCCHAFVHYLRRFRFTESGILCRPTSLNTFPKTSTSSPSNSPTPKWRRLRQFDRAGRVL